MVIWHWFLAITGITNVLWYNWWSGFWGGLQMFGIFVVFTKWYQHHRCARCYRFSRFPVKGTHYSTCHRHATLLTHQKLQLQHKYHYPYQHKLLNQ